MLLTCNLCKNTYFVDEDVFNSHAGNVLCEQCQIPLELSQEASFDYQPSYAQQNYNQYYAQQPQWNEAPQYNPQQYQNQWNDPSNLQPSNNIAQIATNERTIALDFDSVMGEDAVSSIQSNELSQLGITTSASWNDQDPNVQWNDHYAPNKWQQYQNQQQNQPLKLTSSDWDQSPWMAQQQTNNPQTSSPDRVIIGDNSSPQTHNFKTQYLDLSQYRGKASRSSIATPLRKWKITDLSPLHIAILLASFALLILFITLIVVITSGSNPENTQDEELTIVQNEKNTTQNFQTRYNRALESIDYLETYNGRSISSGNILLLTPNKLYLNEQELYSAKPNQSVYDEFPQDAYYIPNLGEALKNTNEEDVLAVISPFTPMKYVFKILYTTKAQRKKFLFALISETNRKLPTGIEILNKDWPPYETKSFEPQPETPIKVNMEKNRIYLQGEGFDIDPQANNTITIDRQAGTFHYAELKKPLAMVKRRHIAVVLTATSDLSYADFIKTTVEVLGSAHDVNFDKLLITPIN